MRIGFVPIDNRPVCYTLPKQICEIDRGIELLMPKREWLGSLTKPANIDEIFKWLESLQQVDALIISLDTLAYGGLVPSRRSKDSFKEIKTRIEHLKKILISKNTKIYAFSSVMRISNNNVNEEEKEYWSDYGKKIFKYSYDLDKNGFVEGIDIPDDILKDYLKTRERNFKVNQIYLKWQKEKLFDTLIFSKDDCAEYGLNVREAKQLAKSGGYVKTGADEIPLSLLSRSITGKIKVTPVFLEPEYKNLVSNYEDVSIENCVRNQLEIANCEITSLKDADILLFVNNFQKHQGEIVMGTDTQSFDKSWEKPERPYIVADVRFANGADNNFVKELLKTDLDENFYGYSAWNTSANTLGSLICTAKIKFLAKKYDDNAFKKTQLTRFLDDWAYQANVRRQKPTMKNLKLSMHNYEKMLYNKLDVTCKINYLFPWERLFEVEIDYI